jgi:sugar phosphate isomerase/epimerase
MELDVGWAKIAGVDAADYLERFPGRFVACHLKDFNPQLPRATAPATAPIPEMVQLVPPGEGIIDFSRILAVMQRTGVHHGYVEVDLAQGDPLDACRRGYRYLADLKSKA